MDDPIKTSRPASDRDPSRQAGPLAARVLRFRRKRDALFKPGLFADPAWDMLLDLLVAEEKGEATTANNLCIASAVPPSTALRWIGVLEEEGIISRQADPHDGRRTLIFLMPATADRLRALLSEF